MWRRDILAALGTAFATAGCTVGHGGDRPVSDAESGGDGVESVSFAEQGFPPTICEEEIDPGGIRAIGDPAFGAAELWPATAEEYRPLDDESTVIGLTAGEQARAYPLTVLNVHEIVNDTFEEPVIVTYCPICRSGMVAERRVDGVPAIFDASGLLWTPPRVQTAAAEKDDRVFSDRKEGVSNRGNLVMYDDRTGSYWSQMLAEGICGPETRQRLSIRPSTVTTWERWRTEHPETEVLLPPPESGLVDLPLGKRR